MTVSARIFALAFATCAPFVAASAVAQDETPPPNRVIYENQPWAAQPDPAVRVAAAPEEGAAGVAQLLCQLDDDGSLGVCLVESQSAEGFGAAARSLSSDYRMAIPSEGLAPVGAGGRWVRFSVAWRPDILTAPQWIRAPAGEDIERAFPERAVRRQVNGRAIIGCTVTEEGRLSACEVIEEEPASYQFGLAALGLVDRYEMAPQTRDGVPLGGAYVEVPVNFVLSGRLTRRRSLEVMSRDELEQQRRGGGVGTDNWRERMGVGSGP